MKTALTFLFLLYGAMLRAQPGSDLRSDFLLKTDYEGAYTTAYKNFPSISRDAKYIAVIHRDYSCCVETPMVISFIKLDSSKTSFDKYSSVYNNTIVVAAVEEDSLALLNRLDTLKKIKKKIRKEKFTALVSAEIFHLVSDTTKQSATITFLRQDNTYTSEDFHWEKTKMPSYCCSGFMIDNSDCQYFPEVTKVWYDPSEKLILLEYGITHLANGCDVGPLYKVVYYK